jgi:hypothetical protein
VNKLLDFFNTDFGQMLNAAWRVALVTMLTLWLQAGLPMRALEIDQVWAWLELGAQAGVTMVIVNYFGPWEKRYGRGKSPAEG